MRKFNWKKSVAIALSTVCMVGALAGCGSSSSDNGNDSAKAEKLSGSITAAGSSSQITPARSTGIIALVL